MNKKTWIIAVMGFLMAPFMSFAQDAQLNLKVTRVNSARGVVAIGLYNAEANKLDSLYIEAKQGTVEGTFEGLEAGKYYVKLYHDANNNRELDKNFFGVPKEGYGFSTNPEAKFGPPEHKELLIDVAGTTNATVKMRYYW